ncbi:hypothetical protein K2Y11_18565 [bacterium]|nr:hypothetical protein [bacterium]
MATTRRAFWKCVLLGAIFLVSAQGSAEPVAVPKLKAICDPPFRVGYRVQGIVAHPESGILFADAGDRLCEYSADGTLVSTKDLPKARLIFATEARRTIAFSQDGKSVVKLLRDRVVVFRSENGDAAFSIDIDNATLKEGIVSFAVLDSDGKVALLTASGTLAIADLKPGSQFESRKIGAAEPVDVVPTKKGFCVAEAHRLRFFSAGKADHERVLQYHKIFDIDVSEDREALVVLGQKNANGGLSIHEIDIAKGTERNETRLEGFFQNARASSNGSFVAVWDTGAKLEVWNLHSRKRILQAPVPSMSKTVACFVAKTRTLAVAGDFGVIWKLDIDQPSESDARFSSVTGLAYKDGASLWSTSYDGTLREWSDSSSRRTLLKSNQLLTGLAFERDKKWAAASGMGRDASAYIVNTKGSRSVVVPGQFEGSEPLSSTAVSPNGKLIAFGGHNVADLFLIDDSGKFVKKIADPRPNPDALVQAVEFLTESRVVSRSRSGRITIWDLTAARILKSWDAASSHYPTLIVSNNRKQIISIVVERVKRPSSRKWRVQFWGSEDGSPGFSTEPQAEEITSLALSPDGNLIAVGSIDGEVRVWNVRERRFRSTVRWHRSAVTVLTFSPNGRFLASGGLDGGIAQSEIRD